MPAVDVTVMICTWNNCGRLRDTLEALTDVAPATASWQLVVVNNNSTDATDATVAAYESRLPIRLVHEQRPGLSRARNRGLAASTGSLLVFTDDDVAPVRGWIDTYWGAFRAHPRSYFGGPVRSRFDGRPPDPRLVPFAPPSVVGLDLGTAVRPPSDQEYFIGANWACPRSYLDLVGGFDETRGLDPSSGAVKVGEEADLMRRLRRAGIGGLYLPDAGVEHCVPSAKCTVKHIGRRLEASAYDEYRNLPPANVARLFGYPRWLVPRLARAAGAAGWRRLTGGDWIRPYMEFRSTLGKMRAQRDLGPARLAVPGRMSD